MIKQTDSSIQKEIPKGVKAAALFVFIGSAINLFIGLNVISLFTPLDILGGSVILAFGLFNILLGLKLRQGRNWARVIVLIFSWILGISGLITLIGAIIPGLIIYYLQFNKINVAYFIKKSYYDELSANRQLKDEVERLKYHAEKLKLEKEIEKIKKGKV